MNCRHCKKHIVALKNADTDELTWVHTDPEYPYLNCRHLAATPEQRETIGEWAARLFGQPGAPSPMDAPTQPL